MPKSKYHNYNLIFHWDPNHYQSIPLLLTLNNLNLIILKPIYNINEDKIHHH